MEAREHSDDRLAVARRIAGALRGAGPGSTTDLEGSLADGTADEFSDIDLRWTIARAQFGAALGAAPAAIASVTPLLSIRSDPEWQGSSSRRLIFVRLSGVPLWWRLDLDVRSDSGADETAEPAHVGPVSEWDPFESALQNALAAIKAMARGSEEDAAGLLSRGFERIGSRPGGGTVAEQVRRLATTVAEERPHLRGFADGVVSQAGRHL